MPYKFLFRGINQRILQATPLNPGCCSVNRNQHPYREQLVGWKYCKFMDLHMGFNHLVKKAYILLLGDCVAPLRTLPLAQGSSNPSQHTWIDLNASASKQALKWTWWRWCVLFCAHIFIRWYPTPSVPFYLLFWNSCWSNLFKFD